MLGPLALVGSFLLCRRYGQKKRVRADNELRQLCKRIPKCELHAHINGSIRDSTLAGLLQKKYSLSETDSKMSRALRLLKVEGDDQRSLSDCFLLFDVIHAVVQTPEVVYRITREVIEDLEADGVTYAELRTTPRRDVMTAEEYVHAVLSAISDYEKSVSHSTCNTFSEFYSDYQNSAKAVAHVPRKIIIVRLLLSINRAQGVASAENTVALAHELRTQEGGLGKYIVGIDFSGNPYSGDFRHFVPILRPPLACPTVGIPVVVRWH